MSKEKEKQNGQTMNQKIMERLNKYNKEKDGRGTEKSKGESKWCWLIECVMGRKRVHQEWDCLCNYVSWNHIKFSIMETLIVISCSIATVLLIAIAVIEVEKRSINK